MCWRNFMDYRPVILSHFGTLLIVSWVKLCTVNIVLLGLDKNENCLICLLQRFKTFLSLFFSHKSSGRYKQLIKSFEIIHISHLLLSFQKDAKILLSLLIASFPSFLIIPLLDNFSC